MTKPWEQISDFYFILNISRSNSHKTAEFEETSAKETRETEELKKKISGKKSCFLIRWCHGKNLQKVNNKRNRENVTDLAGRFH